MSSNSNSPCQFFATKKGCRNGASCPFSHVNIPTPPASTATPKNNRKPRSSPVPKASPATPASEPIASSSSSSSTLASATVSTPRRHPPASRAPVRKPVPKSLQNLTADKAQARAQLRTFEISQVQSRFGSSLKKMCDLASESTNTADEDQNTEFELKIVPSDPDFPYEIDALHVRLVVPLNYPEASPSLTVLNATIPKGFSTNLERGFDAAAHQPKSLLQHLNWLDVNMEQLLQKPPAPTIRFVGNANNNNNQRNSNSSAVSHDTKENSPTLPPALPTPPSPPSAKRAPVLPASPSPPSKPTTPIVQKPVYTSTQLDQASLQRQQQMAQIQARFRSSIQTISPTEIQISLESANKAQMPVVWEGPLWINFLIPKIYPLEPCEIRLKEDGHNPELELWRARNVEAGFRKSVAAMPQHSLFQLLNQLNRDLKDLMSLPKPEAPVAVATQVLSSLTLESSPSTPGAEQPTSAISTEANSKSAPQSLAKSLDNDRNPKLIYVNATQPSRPRNFDHADDQGAMTSEDDDEDSEEESDNDSDNSDDEEDESEEEGTSETRDTAETSSSAPPKRGIEIRMPDLKLEHISLLYCRSLNLLVRCNRCKGLFEIPDLVPQEGGGITGAANKGDTRKWKTCENCQSLLGAHFRTEYIHVQSRTLGYIDLAGCTAFDLLPSAFVPTCEDCDQVLGTGPDHHAETTTVTSASSTATQHQVASTGFRQRVGRGMSATANCRKCHVRMTMTLEGEIKFVKLSPGDLMKASAATLEQLPLKKKLLRNQAKNGGLDFELKVGDPLPRKGACDHYKKSRRWFRFPCCSKIYPCHLCHDEKEADHESEFAKRMVCGHCSREQTVSDKPCVCGESPVKTAHGSGAFWEGGEGMRDKTRMSNKDSKKFKGGNKTVAKKQVGAENARKRAERSKAN